MELIDSASHAGRFALKDGCRFLDVGVDRVRLHQLPALLQQFVNSRSPHQVVTVNVDFVRIARHDVAFREALHAAELAVADGMPLVWLSRLLGKPLVERITGIEVLERSAELAATCGYSMFLLGAESGVADDAATALRARYPGLQIAGTYSPPVGAFTSDEDARMVELVRLAQPDLLFVAFGAPRQDVWIATHREQLNVPVAVGVGGAFNFVAGRIPRAPSWMQNAGLEWAYRLWREPARLWRRYLLNDLPTLFRIIASGLLATKQ